MHISMASNGKPADSNTNHDFSNLLGSFISLTDSTYLKPSTQSQNQTDTSMSMSALVG